MSNHIWEQICHSDLEHEHEHEELWELFHVNTRSSLLDPQISSAAVAVRMLEMAPSLHYEDRPSFALPDVRIPMHIELEQALNKRTSCRALKSCSVSLESLATLLHAAYGETRDNAAGIFPRPFRTIPSAGALYPLEIYFHSVHLEGLDAGLYHFDASRRVVRLIREGDGSRFISEGLVQRSVPFDAALMIFITGLPRRCTFKYGDRGYRFMLLEAGHAAQNLALAGVGLGLASLCIGGFIDSKIDEFLGLDGLDHASLYLMALGMEAGEELSRSSVEMI